VISRISIVITDRGEQAGAVHPNHPPQARLQSAPAGD
jgi:hypothetical protein